MKSVLEKSQTIMKALKGDLSVLGAYLASFLNSKLTMSMPEWRKPYSMLEMSSHISQLCSPSVTKVHYVQFAIKRLSIHHVQIPSLH